jgi:hypothetical protein
MVQLKYFGDSRDFFKYDLITNLLKHNLVCNYVFVPMLTKARQGNNEGNKKPKQRDDRSKELFSFINSCDSKDLRHWESWLTQYVESYTTVEPVNDFFWEDERREAYWKSFEAALATKNALIFLDPDTGLQTGCPAYRKKHGAEKYILNSELRHLYQTMDKSSVLMIYQHLQFNKHKHEGDVRKKVIQASEATQCPYVLAYREDDLAFLFLTKNRGKFSPFCKIIESYEASSCDPYTFIYKKE